jgi:hypothetical protein
MIDYCFGRYGMKRRKAQRLPALVCECGCEILLVPDLEAMGQAIEKHALEHKKKFGLTEGETNVIIDALNAQVFKLALELEITKK